MKGNRIKAGYSIVDRTQTYFERHMNKIWEKHSGEIPLHESWLSKAILSESVWGSVHIWQTYASYFEILFVRVHLQLQWLYPNYLKCTPRYHENYEQSLQSMLVDLFYLQWWDTTPVKKKRHSRGSLWDWGWLSLQYVCNISAFVAISLFAGQSAALVLWIFNILA